MSHSHGGGADAADCKMTMLWNWYTIDTCFLAESWHITNNGMFAASCIGVALLAVALEFMRRLGKEYDALLLRQFHARAAELAARPKTAPPTSCCDNNDQPVSMASPTLIFRASPVEQLIRAVLHAVFFGLAYIVMLLAMYYNGYIIISIIIGAGIGKFLCDWLVYKVNVDEATKATGIEEATVCCG